MYISRILLNVRVPAVRYDLTGLDHLYSTFSAAVGGGEFIYRVDTVPLEKNGYLQPVVLVSDREPDITLCGKPEGFFSSVESFEYRVPVRKGMIFKFFLKANPSTRILFLHSEIDLPELQVKWLESESKSNGFELVECRVTPDGYVSCVEKKEKFLSAIFEGTMKVTDEKKFKNLLNYGIGRGREYGLGLLSVESYGCKNRDVAAEMKAQAGRESSGA